MAEANKAPTETGAPQIDIQAVLASPEVQAAISAAVRMNVERAMAEIANIAAPAPAPMQNAARAEGDGFLSSLAMNIAELSDQGSYKRRVDPEVLRKRNKARGEMFALLKDARDKGLKPQYKLVGKVFFGERLIEPFRKEGKDIVQQEIVWTAAPNDQMLPANDIARQIYAKFRESIGMSVRLGTAIGPDGQKTDLNEKPFWMTPGGLVVQGDPPPRHFVHAPQDNNGLEVWDNNDPRNESISVLGTVMQPVRTSAADAHLMASVRSAP